MKQELVVLTYAIIMFVALASADVGHAARPEGNSFAAAVPSAYMEDPRRIEWQQPEKVLDYLLVRKVTSVADIGAGTGFFTRNFARRLGTSGIVYAIDIDREMLKGIETRARRDGMTNIRTILATAADPLVPASSVDLVFICDTFLFFKDRQQYLGRLRESLKEHGQLAIIAFNARAAVSGAPPMHIMVSRDETVREAEAAGFSLSAEYFFLPYQDFLVFDKR
jgi:ubiquinone/menaquinone biosynthesis C-methylase UbiE